MKTEIHQLSLGHATVFGACNCYLIKEEGLILVDAGFPNQGKKFLKEWSNILTERPRDLLGNQKIVKEKL